jgi:DNA-binding IclR family transcriptional regulator
MTSRPSPVKPARARLEMPAGTQSIQRASLLVRLIASSNRTGVRLADLVRDSRLERPTARRMLKCLVAEGMVLQDEASHRYFLGPLVFELGLAAAPRFNLRELCRASVQRIAERTADTVFLTVRSGYDSVCIDRAEGSFPIKALTLDVGTRRPLGVGAGGLALLMPLTDQAAEDIVAVNAPRLAAYNGLTAQTLLRLLKRSRDLGYSLNDDHIAAGAISMGLPVLNPFGEPFGSISVGAIAARMKPERRPELAATLREEVQWVSRTLTEAATAIRASPHPSR